MKKLTILIAVLLLLSCEKPKDEPTIDPNKGTVTFWTTETSKISANFEGWLLWVDDIKIGVIKKPYPINTTDLIPDCSDKDFTDLVLSKGRHKYYMTVYIPTQAPPNKFTSTTYFFDVIARGCTVVRCIQ
jgi:hypothetical protein